MDHSDVQGHVWVHTWSVQKAGLNHIACLTTMDWETRNQNIYQLERGVALGVSVQGVCHFLALPIVEAWTHPARLASLRGALCAILGTLFKQNGNKNRLQI